MLQYLFRLLSKSSLDMCFSLHRVGNLRHMQRFVHTQNGGRRTRFEVSFLFFL